MTVTDLRNLTAPLHRVPCVFCEHEHGTAYWTPLGCIVVHTHAGEQWACGALVDVAAEVAA